nr:FCS-Like Zinc finger 5-like [Ipomoea batatas]
MMLGKRNRPPFRRTTSMTGITVDVGSGMEDGQPPAVEGQATAVPNGGYDHRSMAMVSPRYYGGRTTSGDIETPSFLTTCSLCNRRLAPCRDIFMYRGDTAFCSEECREQKMKQDERKEKSNNNNMQIENKGGNHHYPTQISNHPGKN